MRVSDQRRGPEDSRTVSQQSIYQIVQERLINEYIKFII